MVANRRGNLARHAAQRVGRSEPEPRGGLQEPVVRTVGPTEGDYGRTERACAASHRKGLLRSPDSRAGRNVEIRGAAPSVPKPSVAPRQAPSRGRAGVARVT